MVRSAVGRRPHLSSLIRLREKLTARRDTRELWDAYEISDPQIPNVCTIESSIGTFTYEALTLAYPRTTAGLVIHVPDKVSRLRLDDAMKISNRSGCLACRYCPDHSRTDVLVGDEADRHDVPSGAARLRRKTTFGLKATG